MKKKADNFFLFVGLMLALAGIVVLVTMNFDLLRSIFVNTNESEVIEATQLYVTIAVLLICWAILFVVLIRQNNNGTLAGYGRTDPLTGLGNKRQLRIAYDRKILKNSGCACLAYLGFDAGKVTRQFGTIMCNTYQKGIAEILASESGEHDCAARIDNGIFAFAFSCKDGLQMQKRMDLLLEKINKFEHKILLEDVALCRSGVNFSNSEPDGFDTAFANASIAYKYANERNTAVLLFSDDLIKHEENKNLLKKKLSRAIDNNEFELFLQFVRDVDADRFIGAEVLSRWNSPDEGFVMPAYYINDMYTVGVIEKFDRYILEKTCALLEKWSNDEQFHDLILSCNITRVTISSEDFIADFRKIVGKYHFNHNQLILEITEDALIDNQTVAYQNIMDCKSDGFMIALDDFGAGNSSINDINEYPIDQLKVDRKFISTVTTKRGAALLQGIIELAHRMEIKVACEGVENKRQRDIVVNNGCDYIQGYYYSYVYSLDECREHFDSQFAVKQ